MKTAIIIPAFNEEKTIANTIKKFNAAMPSAHIYVINNNSTDRTPDLAQDVFNKNLFQGAVIFEKNQGKGFAMRRAFQQIEADVYVMVDADETYPAEALYQICAPILKGDADMVVGDRLSGGSYFNENKRKFHNFGNMLVVRTVNSAFKANLSDIMSGYRAFSRRFVKTYPILVSGFELETEMSIHALDKRLPTCEIPILYKDRPEGSHSKLDTHKDGLRVIFTILNLYRHYRPLIFFNILSLMFCAVGLITGLPAIIDFILFRYVYHIPLALLATGFEVIAFILLAMGVLLDSIAFSNRFKYEMELLNYKKI
jgi:glycosyltransferase involved in cell wall biosynthesis